MLSPAAGWAPYSEDLPAAVVAAAIFGNDLTAELGARMPDRFKALVSLPLPRVEASLRELRRGLDELGMIGANIHRSVLNRPVVEPEFLPIYEELDRRRALVLFHPTSKGICSPMVTEFGLNAAVGTSLEDTLVALHLSARKIPAQFPNITFIVPHLGGPIAMLLERLDDQFWVAQRDCPEPLSVTARRFLLRHGWSWVARGVVARVESICADHLLPGSDFPVLLNSETFARTVA